MRLKLIETEGTNEQGVATVTRKVVNESTGEEVEGVQAVKLVSEGPQRELALSLIRFSVQSESAPPSPLTETT